jgi:alpha-L-fucosidase
MPPVFEGAFQDTKRQGFTAQDVRFTTKGDVLYAIVLDWPESGEAVIESLGTSLALYPGAIKQVEWLGSGEPVQWSRDVDGLKVKTPSERPCRHAYTLKIALKEMV